MGNLIAFGFDRSWAANEVLKRLRIEVTLDDAFVVERADSGPCAVRRAFDDIHPEAGASGARLWGAMARLVFLNPSLDHVIPRGSSALFIALKNAPENRILRAVKPYRPHILKTSLPPEAEQRLKAEFAKAA